MVKRNIKSNNESLTFLLACTNSNNLHNSAGKCELQMALKCFGGAVGDGRWVTGDNSQWRHTEFQIDKRNDVSPN